MVVPLDLTKHLDDYEEWCETIGIPESDNVDFNVIHKTLDEWLKDEYIEYLKNKDNEMVVV